MNILLAEDDNMSRRILEVHFSKVNDIGLYVASDGNQAMKFIENKKIHFAVLDNQMPGHDGKDLAYKIRELDKSREMYSHIILLTADEDFSSFDQTVFDCYIQKPLYGDKIKKLEHHLNAVKALYSSQS